MSRKRLLGLILFAVLVTAGLFMSADYLVSKDSKADTQISQTGTDDNTDEQIAEGAGDSENTSDETSITNEVDGSQTDTSIDITSEEPWLNSNPTDTGNTLTDNSVPETTVTPDGEQASQTAGGTFTTAIDTAEAPQLILDSTKIDYQSYIPEMVYDSGLKKALDISNPGIAVDAEAAILFDADTKKVLFYKNAVQAMFPASTAKLLTSLVALDWCKEEDQVTIGDEITMIAPDSTKAFLSEGQILTVRNILEGMLLPSGNDAAYAMAAYVGRKSLDDPDAPKEKAIAEFVRLMNQKAASLGVKNSCFKTPDGYDAVGQYTTAYDMGLIGVAASKNPVITDISHRSSSRNIFASGEDVTWANTNKLITKYSGQYYSKAIGLKTGTSTMAGRCLIAAAESDGKEVVCVIMNSSLEGRWEDAIALLKYGLE